MDAPASRTPTIFLLSPASTSGLRARQLVSSRAKFDLALAYRDGGVRIDDAFSFMSALYFRGKVAYSRAFATPDPGCEGSAFVIAPGFGLVPMDWTINEERMEKMKRTVVDLKRPSYRRPLEKTARDLASSISPSTRIVLLGSVATGKYVDVLRPIFGDQFLFPRAFAGLGDMSRGGLMLRAARSGEELEYATLDAPRHRIPR